MSKALSRRFRDWTEDEEKFLQDNWGFKSRKSIAKHLKRTKEGVKKKAWRLGLCADPMALVDGITVHQLAQTLNIQPNIITESWISKYDFPYYLGEMGGKKGIRFVDMKLFWDWVKTNIFVIDLNSVEENTLGPEPGWVNLLRRAQFYNNIRLYRNNSEWSSDDDKILEQLLSRYDYTYQQISERLSRSNSSIKRRVRDLGLLARPLSADCKMWTDEQIEIAVKMRKLGYAYEIIGDKLGKTGMAVQAKLERLVNEGKYTKEYLCTFEEEFVNDKLIKHLIY